MKRVTSSDRLKYEELILISSFRTLAADHRHFVVNMLNAMNKRQSAREGERPTLRLVRHDEGNKC